MQEKSFRQKCLEAGVNYNSAVDYKTKNKSTYEEAI